MVNINSYTWYFDGLSKAGVVRSNNPVSFAYDSIGEKQVAVVLTDRLKCLDTLYTSVPVAIYGPRAGFGSAKTGICFGNTSSSLIDSTLTDGTHPIAYGNGVLVKALQKLLFRRLFHTIILNQVHLI